MQKAGLYKRALSSSLSLCLSAGRRAVCVCAMCEYPVKTFLKGDVGWGAFAAPRGQEVQQGVVNHSRSGGGMENQTEL